VRLTAEQRQHAREERSKHLLLSAHAVDLLEIEVEQERLKLCSRCDRFPEAGGGFSPGRVWCRECEAERCRDLYHRRKAPA
jgi:hypothetical protein